MPNKFYQDILKLDISSLIGESNAIDSVVHNGIKGSIREYGLGRVLTKYIPFGWDIGTGQIHNENGEQSNETDLIVFHKALIPPMMFGNNLGFFPIESCRYAIEIKTKSTSKEIQTTISKFNRLKELKSNSIYYPIRTYFAYNNDLKDKSELDRYKELDVNFHTDPAINVICILGKGYWYFTQSNMNGKKTSYWRFMKSYDGNYEMVAFLSGVVNTLNDQNRDNVKFGSYLMIDKHQFENIEIYELKK